MKYIHIFWHKIVENDNEQWTDSSTEYSFYDLIKARLNYNLIRKNIDTELNISINEAQTNKNSVRKPCESAVPGFLHEAQITFCKVKEGIIPKVVFKNEKTKQAWLMLSGLGGVDVDEDGAVALLKERVKDGDTDAMWMLGICYEFGIGIEQNIEQAEKLYQQSGDGGNEIGKFFVSHEDDGRGSGNMKMKRLYMKKQIKIVLC